MGGNQSASSFLDQQQQKMSNIASMCCSEKGDGLKENMKLILPARKSKPRNITSNLSIRKWKADAGTTSTGDDYLICCTPNTAQDEKSLIVPAERGQIRTPRSSGSPRSSPRKHDSRMPIELSQGWSIEEAAALKKSVEVTARAHCIKAPGYKDIQVCNRPMRCETQNTSRAPAILSTSGPK